MTVTSGQQTLNLAPCIITHKGYTEIRIPSIDSNGRWYTRDIKVFGKCRIDMGRDQA
jgi:hypothetical protein